VFPGQIEDYTVNTDPKISAQQFDGGRIEDTAKKAQEDTARDAEQMLADMDEAEADDFYASEDDIYEEQTLQAKAAEQAQEAEQKQQQQQEQQEQQKAQQQQQEEKEEEEELLNAALSSLSPGLGLLPDLLSFADPASWTSPEPTAVDDAIRQLDTVGDLIMLA
jgi:FKBP-type peptidyl-prolyl cis-trans isomerase